MKKASIALLALAAFAAAGGLYAQSSDVAAPDPGKIGVDTAQQKLKEVSVDKFEAAGFWNAYISSDEGFVQARLFEGGPAGKANEPIADERYVGIDPKVADQYVLGVRSHPTQSDIR